MVESGIMSKHLCLVVHPHVVRIPSEGLSVQIVSHDALSSPQRNTYWTALTAPSISASVICETCMTMVLMTCAGASSKDEQSIQRQVISSSEDSCRVRAIRLDLDQLSASWPADEGAISAGLGRAVHVDGQPGEPAPAHQAVATSCLIEKVYAKPIRLRVSAGLGSLRKEARRWASIEVADALSGIRGTEKSNALTCRIEVSRCEGSMMLRACRAGSGSPPEEMVAHRGPGP
jgi:hypothetical protein